jgi:metal-responsive CopG/Arc/MetJ family transcriptional regulator
MLMKTAISLPDDTFEAATRRAAQLGISRSQFFAVAARRYLEELDNLSVTRQINDAIGDVGPDESAAAAVAAGRRGLAGEDGW